MTDYDIWKTSDPDDKTAKIEREPEGDWEDDDNSMTEYEKRINRDY